MALEGKEEEEEERILWVKRRSIFAFVLLFNPFFLLPPSLLQFIPSSSFFLWEDLSFFFLSFFLSFFRERSRTSTTGSNEGIIVRIGIPRG